MSKKLEKCPKCKEMRSAKSFRTSHKHYPKPTCGGCYAKYLKRVNPAYAKAQLLNSKNYVPPPHVKEKLRKYKKKWKDANFYDKDRFLSLTYSGIKDRCTSNRPNTKYWYGKPFLPKDEFLAWAKASTEFHALFEVWVTAGNPRALTPSVNRINSSKGYVPGNIEWVTVSENVAIMNRTRKSRFQSEEKRIVTALILDREEKSNV